MEKIEQKNDDTSTTIYTYKVIQHQHLFNPNSNTEEVHESPHINEDNMVVEDL